MRLLKSLLVLIVLGGLAALVFVWVMPADLAVRWFGARLAPAQ